MDKSDDSKNLTERHTENGRLASESPEENLTQKNGIEIPDSDKYVAPINDSEDLPSKIFQKELEAIKQRRESLGIDVLKVLTKEEIDGKELEPNVDRGLWGLALSGGGIRSATFSLGVMQAIADRNYLKYMDYLSTVSGGGYIGTSLTWLLSKKDWGGKENKLSPFGVKSDDFPYRKYIKGKNNVSQTNSLNYNPMLRYLRQHGKYLTPGNGLTLLSAIGVVMRGLFLSLAVWITLSTLVISGLLYLSEGFSSVIPNFTEFPPFSSLPKDLIPKGTGLSWFNAMIFLEIIFLLVFFIGSLFYSLSSFIILVFRNSESFLYKARRVFERMFVHLTHIPIITFLMLVTLPLVQQGLSGSKSEFVGLISSLMGFASGLWVFFNSTKKKKTKLPLKLVGAIGSFLFLYGLVLLSFEIATFVYQYPENRSIQIGFIVAAAIGTFLGFFVNLNYISIHRFYRDRLMETFMPDVLKALQNKHELTNEADQKRLHELWPKSQVKVGQGLGPYHLINTNLVLVRSANKKLRNRGGDNFFLSPLYSGSSATGWCDSEHLIKGGITLATAMAVSGAAVNPNTGPGGEGLTRNPLVSILMSILGLRLGYWVPNPKTPRHWLIKFLTVNYFTSLFKEVFPPGYTEDSRLLHLSDGGHFENLGVYELIRRKMKTIILCDGAADPDFSFSDLQTALRLVRLDFGAEVVFRKGYEIEKLIPKNKLLFPKNVDVADRGYALGDITYNDGEKGILIYLKTTMIKDLSVESLGYKEGNPTYPDETTADQFFDVDQFEAYRELGEVIADQMLNDEVVQEIFYSSGKKHSTTESLELSRKIQKLRDHRLFEELVEAIETI